MRFDSREAGTDPRRWDAMLDGLRPLALGELDRVVVVAPHPDDESLGAGGLLVALAARGVAVHVVVVTDGGASHPGDASTRTAERRANEARAAVDLLAPGATLTLLGFPDGGVDQVRDAVRTALARVVGSGDDADDAADDDTAGAGGRPRTLVVAPWRGDGHRDHRVVGEVCADVAREAGARLWEYPVWMWHWGTPEDPAVPAEALRALPLTPDEVVRKNRAIRAHESQVFSEAGAPVLHGRFLAHFDRDVEVYVVPDDADATPALPTEHFEDLHARKSDPWGFEDRWYEERKRAVTMSSLPARDLGRVLEIGCSIGVLTQQLAARASSVVATDVSRSAVRRCEERLRSAGLAERVRVTVSSAREELPPGPFDVVVLSEVGYYLSEDDLVSLVSRIPAVLTGDGTVLSCHWRHPVADYPLCGDTVQDVVDRHLGLARLVQHVEDDFALSVHSADARSVARREGLS